MTSGVELNKESNIMKQKWKAEDKFNIVEDKTDVIYKITHPAWDKVSSNWLIASVIVLAIAVSNPPPWMLYYVGILLMALSYMAYRFGKHKVK